VSWDEEFIRYYRKLEEDQHAWNKLNPLTRRLYDFIDPQSRDNETLELNSKAPWDFKRLHSLGFKTVLNAESTGAQTVTLYRNEHGRYFIRIGGGCVVYADALYGPFEHTEQEFRWPEAQAKAQSEPAPKSPVVSPERDALFLAIAENRKDKVYTLIKNYPDVVNQAGADSTTALILAATLNRTEIAGLLLEAHADPDRADARGFTALMFAVINKNKDLVRQILRYKPNLTAKNNEGYSAADYVKLLGWQREFETLKGLKP
jgi:hypothetical protein